MHKKPDCTMFLRNWKGEPKLYLLELEEPVGPRALNGPDLEAYFRLTGQTWA